MNVAEIRKDFPILAREVHGKRLVYLDNAATSQKPRQVIDAIKEYYESYNANVHRAIHALGEQATAAYEEARAKVARFINAPSERCIVWVKNASEAINLVAYAWGRKNVGEGDEILVSPMEHHSNLVPWQELARARGARLKFFNLTPEGRLDLENLDTLLTPRTKIVAITHASNVLGTINPVADIARKAHEVGCLILVDGAQSAPHMPVDVQALDCDFFVFSAHKMCGPMGIGVLYGKEEILEAMDPFLFGGEMISTVTLERSTWNDIPWKFEAGTPNVAGAIGFGAAIDYLEAIGMEAIQEHERELVAYAWEALSELDGMVLYGPKEERSGLIAFNYAEIHPHDLSTVLDQEGIAIRAGHHCAEPLMRWLDVPATARASFYLYNTREDIDALVRGLLRAKEFFAHVP
ncbi:MAG TPA: cysteine desulfurase [Limnochordia bacterium]|nr:cysteine desulfurase [Limnochordia bacterium]